MRILLAIALAAVCAPTAALAAAPRTAIFYYPWYGSTARDGAYEHWSQAGHDPPVDIASNFYPARGAYSSSNPAVLQSQMREIAPAGGGQGGSFGRLCAEAHRLNLLCAPSVGPGYQATAATGDIRVKPRLNGATYDTMWRSALAASADLVTITSYNEWSEGTQIEPASSRENGYETYDGSYGLSGKAAQRAYLMRTAHWTAQLAVR